MKVIRWENPPPKIGGGGRQTGFRLNAPDPYQEVAADLAANPGRWAVVYEGANGSASGMASQIRRGQTTAWQPAGDYEAVSRKRDGVTAVYARYTGPVMSA